MSLPTFLIGVLLIWLFSVELGGLPSFGRGETVNLLNEWMDPHHIRTEAFASLTPGQREAMNGHPKMRRFWQVLPPKGLIGILFGKWSGTEVKVNGKDLLIMKESDILGIIE